MNRPEYGARVHALRVALAQSPRLDSAQLAERVDCCESAKQAAVLLLLDLRAGLVTREPTGTRPAWRYSLTEEGHRAATNPNYLRRSARRRNRGHRPPRIAALMEAISHAR